jgi:hypothetical protein
MAEQTTSKETKTMSTQMPGTRSVRPSHGLRAALAALCAFAAFAVFAIPAQASQPIEFFKINSEQTEAGAHPDISTEFTLPAPEPGQPEEVAKTIEAKWPTGVFGNPRAVPPCENDDFALNECASLSQVGWIGVVGKSGSQQNHIFGVAPIYDMEPSGEDETARFAFTVPEVNIPINIPIRVRTGSDYGLTVGVTGITQELPLRQANLTVWGFPAEGGNDSLRFPKGSPGEPSGCPGQLIPEPEGCADLSKPVQAGILVRPLIDNPTVCTHSELPIELIVNSYKDPTPSTAKALYPETTGCNTEVFRPEFDVGLTTAEADAPSGLNLRLVAHQVLGHTNSPSELRSAYVNLPVGLSVNPDAADGQLACSDAQAEFGTELKSHCPDNSKIGTMEVHTPALNGPLKGSLYIGEPKPGNQYRLFMLFDGFGVHAKLSPDVIPDPETGQVKVSLSDLPQVPFEEFDLHLFASDRGLMATPTRCTLYPTEGEFVPWNDQDSPQTLKPNFAISQGPNGTPCPSGTRPFHPRLVAGTSTPVAGAFSSFTLKLDRDDGDQYLGDLNFRMPPGLTGSLRGLGYCPEASILAAANKLGRAEQAQPSCPASSQIGTTNVAAGPGSHPFHAVGKMYLSGPFKGAPLSLAAITPALAGPYDYGTVVVRVALNIDPHDAHVVAVSDTVPSIIGGIPIRMRSIQVNIDRPNFMINPTNCSPFSVESQGIGDEGTVTEFSSFFESVNCRALPFQPRMTVRQLGGRKATGRSKNPPMRFDLYTRPGDANIKSLSVTLPKAFEIDQRHLGNICSRTQLQTERCAGRQPIGVGTTVTPLLEQPLKGPAYAVSGFGKLPHVVFILGGQVTIMPEAESSSVNHGHLKTTVPVVPDAPVGHFSLRLFGGKRGYLANTRNLCASPAISTIEYTGQNGSPYRQRVKTKTACGHKGSHARRHRRHHH